MATLFPGANDSFTEPSAPASTPLANDGGSGRNMNINHRDMGDAIMAMQAEATLLVHTHDGSARNGSKLSQANTHQSADTDTSTSAIHHTIGTGSNQGAAGDHSHSVGVVWPVGAIFITEVAGNPSGAPHNLPGTWTAITGTFIVAAGSTFAAGTTGGSATHTHTASFGSAGGHTHTSPLSSTDGLHNHGMGDTGFTTFSHTHSNSSSNSGSADSFDVYNLATTGYAVYNASHSHSTGTSDSTSHSHSVNATSFDASHFHSFSGVDSQGSHAHTSTINSDANNNLPAYLVVYMWYRSA